MSECGSECHVQSAVLGQKSKSSSFFSAPGLFVGLNFKISPDSDSVKSPTSPLELRVFSNLSNSVGSPKSSHEGHRRSWDCSKVGLGIVDSLDDDIKIISKKVLGSSESKNIIFGPQIRTKPAILQADTLIPQAARSLPKNCAIFPFKSTSGGSSEIFFEIGEPLESKPLRNSGAYLLDSRRFISASANPSVKNVISNGEMDARGPNSNKTLCKESSIPASVAPVNEIIASLSASEIELSEDYTCVISHGANPKTTHIYGDCILECHSADLSNFVRNDVIEMGSSPYQPRDFLCFCNFCNNKLEDGKDIYIYRGEKGFCSLSCREQQIMIDEELEKSVCKTSEKSLTSKDGNELFEVVVAD